MAIGIKRGIAAALVAFCATGTAHAINLDLVQLFESHNPVSRDTFLTTDIGQDTAAVDIHGGVRRGVAAWLPCAPPTTLGPNGESPLPGTSNPNMGFDAGTPMNFTCAKPPLSHPFYRLYKGAPDTDHFYTRSVAEANSAIANGYVFERVEGYIFQTPPIGSTALYQLAKCWPVAGGCDFEHRYTISSYARDQLIADGWGYAGIAGYVYDSYANDTVPAKFNGTYNGITVNSVSPTAVAIQNVTPTKSPLVVKGTERNPLHGYRQSNSTPRPAGAAKMRAKFSFYTGDLFGASSNINHIPIVLYGHAQAATDGISAAPVDGIGIFFAKASSTWSTSCPGTPVAGGQIWVELYGARARVECETNLDTPLAASTWYDLVLTVDDNAVLDLEVRFSSAGGTGPRLPFKTGHVHPPVSYASRYPCPLYPTAVTLTAANAHCANPFAQDRMPNQRTGYLVIPVFEASATPATGGTITNFTIQWLDASNNVLTSL